MKTTATHAPSWQRWLVIFLRTAAIIAGTYQLFFGELMIGVYTLIATAAIMLPGFFTRNYVRSVPLELELIFTFMVFMQLVIGETLNFYSSVPYYDKFMHFSMPFFIGIMSFLLAYTLHITGGLRMTMGPLVVIVVCITMGLGAAWEIIEYLSDTFLTPHFHFGPLQGSATEPPLVDTMNDLIFDLLGALFGAVLALRYIEYEKHHNGSRLNHLLNDIAGSFSKK